MPVCTNCKIDWVDANPIWSYCPSCGGGLGCLTQMMQMVIGGVVLVAICLGLAFGGCFRSGPPVVPTPGVGGGVGEGILHLKTGHAVRKDVVAWVEVNGQKAVDWKSGTTEVKIKLPAGAHRVVVKSIFEGKELTIFDNQVTIQANATADVNVGP
jgi:hypothetical protein